jgi:hypothetical protein
VDHSDIKTHGFILPKTVSLDYCVTEQEFSPMWHRMIPRSAATFLVAVS